jgi:hypothetical protein
MDSDMRDVRTDPKRLLIDRLASVAFTFLVMNYSAVAGLVSALTGRNRWR